MECAVGGWEGRRFGFGLSKDDFRMDWVFRCSFT